MTVTCQHSKFKACYRSLQYSHRICRLLQVWGSLVSGLVPRRRVDSMSQFLFHLVRWLILIKVKEWFRLQTIEGTITNGVTPWACACSVTMTSVLECQPLARMLYRLTYLSNWIWVCKLLLRLEYRICIFVDGAWPAWVCVECTQSWGLLMSEVILGSTEEPTWIKYVGFPADSFCFSRAFIKGKASSGLMLSAACTMTPTRDHQYRFLIL